MVLVADGLFSTPYAQVAVEEVCRLGARRIVFASPIVSRDVDTYLEGKVEAVVALERATLVDACVYRDDVLPSDIVAYELLAAPRSARVES